MENLDRNNRQELEDYLNKTEEMNNKIQEEITRVRDELRKLDEKEAELNKEYVIEIPEQGLYLISEGTWLEEYTQEDLECEGWNVPIINKLGVIRNTAESAWVSARRNIRANRLEALAHSIGGAYEFDFDKPNFYVLIGKDGKFTFSNTCTYLEPEKIYMTRDTAEKVCEILNSGRYKLNVDVAVEEDCCDYDGGEYVECPCCACQGNDC